MQTKETIDTLSGILSSKFPCEQASEYSNSDLYSLKNCVSYAMSELNTTGGSISDNVSLFMKNNTMMFMKIFVTDVPKDLHINQLMFTRNVLPLMYEQMVCLSRINKLVQQNICPFFVVAKGGNVHIPYPMLYEFFTNLLVVTHVNGKKLSNVHQYSQIKDVKYTLLRNLDTNLSIIKNKKKRSNKLSLSNASTNYDFIHKTDLLQQCKFGFILTSSVYNSVNLQTMLYQLFQPICSKSNEGTQITYLSDMYGQKFSDINSKLLIVFSTVANILFQAAIATSAMQMIKTIHNDLHANNALLQLYSPDNLKIITMYYNSNPNSRSRIFNFKTNLVLKIFDFDRAFVYGNKTENSQIPNYQEFVDANIVSNKRDFLKLFQAIIDIFNKCVSKYGITKEVLTACQSFFNQLCKIVLKSPVVTIYNYNNSLIYATPNNKASYLEVFLDFNNNIPVDAKFQTKDALNRNISDKTFDSFRELGEIAENIHDHLLSTLIVPVKEKLNEKPCILCANMFDEHGNISEIQKIRYENQFYSELNVLLQK